MSAGITNIKPGEKVPPLPVLDPEHGFDAVRQTISIEAPDQPQPLPPLSIRLLDRVDAAKRKAETDPAAAFAELCDLVHFMINRIF